eukprot:jgi/Chlat1/5332/Chrsp35S05264
MKEHDRCCLLQHSYAMHNADITALSSQPAAAAVWAPAATLAVRHVSIALTTTSLVGASTSQFSRRSSAAGKAVLQARRRFSSHLTGRPSWTPPPPLCSSAPACSTRLCRPSFAVRASAAAAAVTSPPPQPAAAQTFPASSAVSDSMEALFAEALKKAFPDMDVEPSVAVCQNTTYGDYQCNNAMGLFGRLKKERPGEYKNPQVVAKAILDALPESKMIEKTSIAGAGFINVTVSKQWVAEYVMQMVRQGVQAWAPKINYSRCLVDFSSPNIAKEMHVGHLRSTILGETLARLLKFCGADVLRRNHFGMLIEYLFERSPDFLSQEAETAVGDLMALYKASKLKFDADEEFRKRAQLAVVKLQSGEPAIREAWKRICDVSRNEFDQLYMRLDVQLEEKGESFYNPYIPAVLEELKQKGLAEISEGALCVFNTKISKVPLIVQKSDGGFNYASTDLACIKYRVEEEKANWVVYVTDVGQKPHFDMVFDTAKRAGWIQEGVRIDHVGFGLVLGEDGKRFRTRSTEVVRLVDLLDEAKKRCKDQLIERGKDKELTPEELEDAAEALGYGAVKYMDLHQSRTTNYTFSFDRMLDLKGNTAVYLMYAYVRIASIVRKAPRDISLLKEENSIALKTPSEVALAMLLIRFTEVVKVVVDELHPHKLCEYLYDVSGAFTEFYTECKVLGSDEEDSRLLLCEATAMVMRQCFELLGIRRLERL